jgi:hypothetical protein
VSVTVTALVVFAVAGCGGNSYSASVRQLFLSACEHTQSASTCTCALGHIEPNVSAGVVLLDELEVIKGPASYPSWMTGAVGLCGGDQ